MSERTVLGPITAQLWFNLIRCFFPCMIIRIENNLNKKDNNIFNVKCIALILIRKHFFLNFWNEKISLVYDGQLKSS